MPEPLSGQSSTDVTIVCSREEAEAVERVLGAWCDEREPLSDRTRRVTRFWARLHKLLLSGQSDTEEKR